MPKDTSKPKRAAAEGRKGKGKTKAKKDPNAPKRPQTAFFAFSAEFREEVKNENPDAGIGGVAKILGEKWRNLDESEKKKYNDMAAADKLRYEKELAEYNAKKKSEPEAEAEEEEEE